MSETTGELHWTDYAEFPRTRRETLFGSRVLRCFADRARSFHALFLEGVGAEAAQDAIVDADRSLSYREIDALIARAAAGLRLRNVQPGDRVALLLHNSMEYVVLLFALARLGAISVPLNLREGPAELGFILNDCQASTVLCAADVLDRLPAKEELPSVETIEAIDLSSANPLAAFCNDGAIDDPVPVNEEDVAIILYTSGTTGRPKGAMLTHVNIVHSVYHYRYAMRLGPADRSVIAVPMSHVTGLVALVTTVISAGATLIVMREFKADSFLQLAVTQRMSHTLLVPAMFALCLLRDDIERYDLSAWRVSGYGGAIMPAATLARIEKIVPKLELINCYGATETTSPAVMMPPLFSIERPQQVGLAVPCGDIRVMDPDGREVPNNETGEIWIRGPMVVPGYWNNPEATAKEFTGGYWRSGDIGARDERGFIQIVDRLKDLINRGGYKIYASEVENVLLTHAGVQEVAVVAKSCPVLGERVHAFVVAADGVDAEVLTKHAATELAQYKQPEAYHFISTLPRNANGKVLKRDLRVLLENNK